MLPTPHISILLRPRHQTPPNYCLEFPGNGHITINPLNQFLDHSINFLFSMQFKVNAFPQTGFSFLMSSCLNKNDNKVGIAIGEGNIYVQVNKGIGNITEFSGSFSDNRVWHEIKIINNSGLLSVILDQSMLSINLSPDLTLTSTVGFRIASSTANSQYFTGLVDDILITNLIEPRAHYPLNEGTGTIAYDAVGNNDGSIVGGSWVIK